jgi:rod shape-determining protein MreB
MNLPVKRFFNRSHSPQVAVDLGTANTRVYVTGRGLIADQPTWEPSKRLRPSSSCITKQDLNREKSTQVDFESQNLPLQGGVIKDVDQTIKALSPLIKKAKNWNRSQQSVLAFAPSDATADEKEALKEALQRAGAFRVSLIEEPYAAAVGGGLDLSSPYSQLLLDLGDGVADMVVLRRGEVIYSDASRVRGGSICGIICELAARHHMILSQQDTITLIHYVLSRKDHPSSHMVVDVRPFLFSECSQVPNGMILDMAGFLDSILNAIGEKVSDFIRGLPHQEAVEIIESGIYLTGGGACLPGWPQEISTVTGIDVHTVPEPFHSVIWGARKLLSGRLEY